MTLDVSYFDSSAVTKLLVPEEFGAERARMIFRRPVPHYTSMLTYPEAHSALARRSRNHELSESRLRYTLGWLDDVWREFIVLPVEQNLLTQAADLVLQHPVSGADAVHLATALSIPAANVIFVTWDRRQAEAANDLGLIVQPPIV